MKKYIVIGILLSCIVIGYNFLGENVKDNIAKEQQITEKSYTDCTLKVEKLFEPSKDGVYNMVKSAACFSETFENVEELYPNADNIVVGKVVDLIYDAL